MKLFLPMEHSGGDGWTILHGDTLQIIRAFSRRCSTPSSPIRPMLRAAGSPAEKNRTTNPEIQQHGPENALPDFDGDNRDQRSWTRWMAEWLSDARKSLQAGSARLPVH